MPNNAMLCNSLVTEQLYQRADLEKKNIFLKQSSFWKQKWDYYKELYINFKPPNIRSYTEAQQVHIISI